MRVVVSVTNGDHSVEVSRTSDVPSVSVSPSAAVRLLDAAADDARRALSPTAPPAAADEPTKPPRRPGTGRFEVYEDLAGRYRFRLKASNGQVVATGEAYETSAAARKGCESVQRAADDATIEDVTS